MGKLLSRVRACTLSAVLLTATVLSACSSKEETVEKSVKLWTAPSYIKIYQDIDYSKDEAYTDWYESTELNVSMFMNEKEGGQVIVTPDYDVDKYTVSVSDLTGKDGQKIAKENVTVYNQKYVDVLVPSKAHTNSIIGMVPDALLPFEKAVEYGENKIGKNNNQGIYLEVDSKDVSAGEYTGNIQLTVDNKTHNVPLTVTVWDATVSEETHLKSSFLLRNQELLENEKDGTDEMYTTYYEQFVDYRLNITKFTQSFDEETYIEGLRKYYPEPGISTLHFPRCEDASRTNYDENLVKYWFKRLAEICFEDETNYYSKLYYYLAIIDEPHLTKTEDKVVPIFKKFAVARHTTIRELQENRASYDVSDELFNAVVDGIENFQLLLTCAYRADFLYENNKSTPENPDEEYVITWCPYMSAYNNEIDAEKHRNEGIAEWWYSCNYPVNPYPTYHLDDAILPARLLSWMAYEHNVVGNLYWRVNYSSEENAFGVRETVEDPYDITNLTQETNGEGLLVYPGKPYGIKGFVPSLRLVAIRDGMEDYEVLRYAGEKCKQIAKDAGYADFDLNTTFSKLYQALYSGTKVTGGPDDFTESRELLSKIAVFADKGTIISDVQNKPYSTIVKVYVSNGTLKVNGKEANFTVNGSGKEYTVEIKQDKETNYLKCTLEQGSESFDFEMLIGGEKKALDLAKVSFKSNNKVNEISTSKGSDGVTVTMGALKLKEDGSKWEDETQRIYLSGDVLSDTLKKGKGVTAIMIEIENLGEAFDLSVKYTGTRSSGDVFTFTEQRIEANTTAIVMIETSVLTWDFGAVEQLRLHLKYDDVYQEHAIKIKSLICAF